MRTTTLAVAIGALALTAACSSSGGSGSGSTSGGADLGTIRLATVTPFDLSDAPVFDDSTWQGTGLTVKRIVATSPTADPLLATGGADIVIQSSNKAVADIAKGLPATIMAANSLSWGQNIIAKPGITDPSQLKGKTFGVSGFGSGGYFATLKVAENFGWSKSDYKVTQLGGVDQLTAGLKSGAIDAFIWNPQQAAQLQTEGVGKDLGSVDPYIKAAGSVFSVSKKLIQQRPDAVKAFFDAYFKQVAKYKADPTLALNLAISGKYKQDKATVEGVYKEIIPEMSDDGSIPAPNLQGMAEAAKLSDDTLKDVDTTEIYRFWQGMQ